MASPTSAVDSTASASTPGARKSTGSSTPGGVGGTATTEKEAGRATGMARVSSSDSPRRSVRRSSAPVWARTAVVLTGDGPFSPAGRGGNHHVLQAGPPGPEVAQGQVPLGQPGGEVGHGRRGGFGVDVVLPGAHLPHRGG